MSVISIVVPVYNVEAYLPRCLDSILAQTHSNFELLLVDDGSTDTSPDICDQYAQKDSRIRVVHQNNQGVSAARNLGIDWVLQNSESEWLTFIDSDDWIHPRMLESLLNAAISQNKYISSCSFLSTAEQIPYYTVFPPHTEVLLTSNFYINRTINFVVPWGKLYHKNTFEDIRFPIGLRYEDEYTTYKVLFQYDSLAYIDAPLYYYYVNPNGFMNNGWSPQRLQSLGALKEHILFFRRKGNPELLHTAVHRYVEEIVGHLRCIDGSPNPLQYESEARQIVHEARKYILQYWPACVFDIQRDRRILERLFPRIMRFYRK